MLRFTSNGRVCEWSHAFAVWRQQNDSNWQATSTGRDTKKMLVGNRSREFLMKSWE